MAAGHSPPPPTAARSSRAKGIPRSQIADSFLYPRILRQIVARDGPGHVSRGQPHVRLGSEQFVDRAVWSQQQFGLDREYHPAPGQPATSACCLASLKFARPPRRMGPLPKRPLAGGRVGSGRDRVNDCGRHMMSQQPTGEDGHDQCNRHRTKVRNGWLEVTTEADTEGQWQCLNTAQEK